VSAGEREAMRLSIVLVSYNAADDLERCLASIAAHPPAVPHEILVVDNASTDGSPDRVRARWPAVRLLPLPANLGFAAACNRGIQAATGDLVLLLNSDTLVPPGAIDRLVDRLARDPTVTVVGPRLVDAAGVPELSFGRMIGPLVEARRKLVAALLARRAAPVVRWARWWTSREHETEWVSGACLLVRRDAALRAGLLDERFTLYTEDVDFCAAIRAGGGRVIFTPAAEVVHLRGRSRAAAPAAAEAAYRRSQLAFYAKHHPRWLPWLRAYLRLRGKLPASAAGPRGGA
jgi:N-acetylglucosaminyl-diphospho-decaprenol L-rhamnosyltransferase